MNRIICGNCLEVMPGLAPADVVFADPPDNLGMKYNGFVDRWESKDKYIDFLGQIQRWGVLRGHVFWLSFYYKYMVDVLGRLENAQEVLGKHLDSRLFIWYYTFGQQQKKDFKNCFRPIIRVSRKNHGWNMEDVKVPSARQTKYNDKRAVEGGCIPGDVWEFPRVCGTFKERRKWSPNQHPEALMERVVKSSCPPGGTVIDMFGGSFTTARVCDRLGVDCISIEISRENCEHGAEELGCEVEL